MKNFHSYYGRRQGEALEVGGRRKVISTSLIFLKVSHVSLVTSSATTLFANATTKIASATTKKYSGTTPRTIFETYENRRKQSSSK